MQPNELMDKILKEEKNQENRSDRDDCPFQKFDFVENHKLFDLVSAEQIGSLETKAQQSRADGKGIREAIVGLEAQLVVTTRNKKCQSSYDNNDCVTLEISNRQGEIKTAQPKCKSKITKMVVTRSNTLLKKQEHAVHQ